MSSGLYSGASGLSVGTGLYKTIQGLWSGASGLVSGGEGSSGLWILTTGFWDDTGIWVDSANWID